MTNKTIAQDGYKPLETHGYKPSSNPCPNPANNPPGAGYIPTTPQGGSPGNPPKKP